MPTTIAWFRQDLRLQDNSALVAAAARGVVVPVFVFDEAGAEKLGGASRWWLHHSLAALDEALRQRGSRLVLVAGQPETTLPKLAKDVSADAVYWNRRYEPALNEQTKAVTAALQSDGIATAEFSGALLYEPDAVRNRQGQPFQVFTPFWRHCLSLPVPSPEKRSSRALPAPARWPDSVTLESFGLRPRIGWDREFYDAWQPGEAGAHKRLRHFCGPSLDAYDTDRDLPAMGGTSLLSPHLHFGEITPRQIWAAVRATSEESGVFPRSRGATVFLQEIGWREFGYHLLTHYPDTPTKPLRAQFARFPWAKDPGRRKLTAWQRGQTGYPIVDAGMRQLWRTGWMHNRVRMVVASFLVKHLRLPWLEGANWFWDTLVDADLASNTLGWQWSAGCGADAAPYFRIFAPVAQGEKFDADGEYVRRWVPELARVPNEFIHAPWTAPAGVLEAVGVTLGQTYPRPIVDHATARAEALAAFQSLRETTSA